MKRHTLVISGGSKPGAISRSREAIAAKAAELAPAIRANAANLEMVIVTDFQ